METKQHPPSFTVSLRGYDREEVDQYLDSLAEALRNVEDAEERNRRLQVHVARLNARVKDLEERIQSDTPKTGAVLGERIALMLSMAEETAAETINRAEVKAAETVGAADKRMSEAEEEVRSAVAKGEEESRRIEAEGRATAAEMVGEAEARASARTRQIEQWAEDVVARTRAEDARLHKEQQVRRDAATAEVDALIAQRGRVASALADLRDSLDQSLGVTNDSAEMDPHALTAASTEDPAGAPVGQADGEAARENQPGGPGGEASKSEDQREPDGTGGAPSGPTAGSGPAAASASASAATAAATGWHPAVVFDDVVDTTDPSGEVVTGVESSGVQAATGAASSCAETGRPAGAMDDFDEKLEAWVSEGARHFRRD